jgi:hypothetical protein
MAEPEEKPPEKEPSVWKQFLEDLSWDVPFARAFGNLLLRLFVAEGKAVRHGWFAFVVFIGVAVWITHSRTEGDIDEKLSGITNYFSGQISGLNNQLSDLKGQLKDARQDRDKYQMMLAPFEAMAIAKYTNAPMDQRLDLLGNEMTAMESAIKDAVTGIPKQAFHFNLMINPISSPLKRHRADS